MTENNKKIIVVNNSNLGKQEFICIQMVSGSTVQSKNIFRDMAANLKNTIGGELKGYTQMLNKSRREAQDRMIQEALQLDADAVINVRFSSNSVTHGAVEILAYGTAVKFI